MTRDEIFNLARENILSVTFTKKDGTTRIMKCTLRDDIIPTAQDDLLRQSGFTPDRPVNERVLPVWDMEVRGWRSFIVENVTTVTLAEE